MDLLYMNNAKEDMGILRNYQLDMAYGDDENDFECKMASRFHCCEAGWGLYVEGTEYGGIIDSIESDTVNDEVIYLGRTWHGILGSKIVLPLQEGEVSTSSVAVKATDSDGVSMVGRYLVISGDANACMQFILDRAGLGDLFETPDTSAGTDIEAYQFHRYTDAYTGIRKMLESAGLKLCMAYTDGKVVVSAAKRYNYATDDEFDTRMMRLKVKKNYRTVNHLICLGTGELEERMVAHLYTDPNGNISETQTQFGLDEYAAVYDYSSVESKEELVRGGTERLQELWNQDELSVDFDDESTVYDIGDIVGAFDNITGITVTAPIIKKIVTIKNGQIAVDLTTGEATGISNN